MGRKRTREKNTDKKGDLVDQYKQLNAAESRKHKYRRIEKASATTTAEILPPVVVVPEAPAISNPSLGSGSITFFTPSEPELLPSHLTSSFKPWEQEDLDEALSEWINTL